MLKVIGIHSLINIVFEEGLRQRTQISGNSVRKQCDGENNVMERVVFKEYLKLLNRLYDITW